MRLAAPTPSMFPPKGATFRYASSKSCLEYRHSSHSARAACFALPDGVLVFNLYSSLASCIVSVEPPWRSPPEYVRNAARLSATGFTPG